LSNSFTFYLVSHFFVPSFLYVEWSSVPGRPFSRFSLCRMFCLKIHLPAREQWHTASASTCWSSSTWNIKKQKPTFSLLLFSSLSVNKISIQSLSLNCQTQSWETNQKVAQLLQHPMQKIEMKWMYFSKDKHAHCFQAFLCLRLFHTQP